MKLLVLDTSMPEMVVGLVSGEQVVSEVHRNSRSHSRRLLPIMNDLFSTAGSKPAELDGVVVGIGPGSFTGVRIGLTIAKTLAFASQVPLVGVSSLLALAEGGRELQVENICPALDALKGEVFCARYQVCDGAMQIQDLESARAPDQWAEELKSVDGKCLLLGTGPLHYRNLFEEKLGDLAVIPEEPDLHRISAISLGRLGKKRIADNRLDDPHSLEPVYCRLSEAELSKLKVNRPNNRA